MLKTKKFAFAVVVSALCILSTPTAFCNDEVPVRVEHTIHDVKLTHLPATIILDTCEQRLVKKCEQLPESTFGCWDGFSFDPYFDFTTYSWYITPVGIDTVPIDEIVRGDVPEPTYDLTCEGDCIAGCNEPPPEPEELFCVASTLAYCNNVCPRLFQDENGNNAGQCFEIPNGSADGSNCWGCQNRNNPSEVWSPEDLPRVGGGRPERVPFIRFEGPYGDFDDFGGGGGSLHCWTVCVEDMHGRVISCDHQCAVY